VQRRGEDGEQLRGAAAGLGGGGGSGGGVGSELSERLRRE
jgi:hypothetical protein